MKNTILTKKAFNLMKSRNNGTSLRTTTMAMNMMNNNTIISGMMNRITTGFNQSSHSYHYSKVLNNNNNNTGNSSSLENEFKYSKEELIEILHNVEENIQSHKLFNQVKNLPNQPEENLFLKWNSITQIVNQSYYQVLRQYDPKSFSLSNGDKSSQFQQDEGELTNQILLKVVLFKNELYKFTDLNMIDFIMRITKLFELNDLLINSDKSSADDSNNFVRGGGLSDENVKEIYKQTFSIIMDEQSNDSIYYQELKAIGQSGPNDLYQRNEMTKPIIARAQYEVITKYFQDSNHLSHWLQYRCSLEEWYHRTGCKDQEIIDRTREFHDWQLDVIVGRDEKKKSSKKFKNFVLILLGITIAIVGGVYIGMGNTTNNTTNNKQEEN